MAAVASRQLEAASKKQAFMCRGHAQANIEDNKIATGKQRTLSNPVQKSLRPIFV
jgi:hypothetical protein